MASPVPSDAAWHALMQERSIQFAFPDSTPPPPPPDWLQQTIRFLIAHAAWFRYGGWVLLAAIVLTAGYFLVRAARRHGLAPLAANPARPMPAWQPSPEQARLLLADADALAAEGRFAEAAHLLLLVAIQEIGERRPGLVLPALTSREIAGLPALSPRARMVFSQIARLVERARFGGRTLGPEDFAACRLAFEQFTIPETWQAAA